VETNRPATHNAVIGKFRGCNIMAKDLTRRDWLHGLGTACGAVILATTERAASAEPDEQHSKEIHAGDLPQHAGRTASEPFGYCLNTSTIRGQKLPLEQELEIAAKAGFQAIEPWINEIRQFQNDGGSLVELKHRVADLGLTVESVIAFTEWIVDDEPRRTNAMEELKREMDTVAQLGGKRIACPPSGATNVAMTDLHVIGQRYRTVCELGEKIGVAAELEIWGGSKTLSRLGDAAQVMIEAAHPRACLLPDVFHLYKGGSEIEGFRVINGKTIPVIHMNDYPGLPSRNQATDAVRVYPGDGIAPLGQLLRILKDSGFQGYLSVELFNRQYWEQDAALVARTALEKTRVTVLQALKA
jgi:sugar phosphate isomerase/epimerase